MSEENKALVRRWFEEVWNKGRAEAIDEMFDEYGVAHGFRPTLQNQLQGRETSNRFIHYSAKPSQIC